MPNSREWTRVIVLAPDDVDDGAGADALRDAQSRQLGSGLTEPLKRLFAQRDWFAVRQCDPCLALAELCLRERAQVARAAWGLKPMERIALVILHPQRWPALEDLVAAARCYVPAASIWTASDSEVFPLGAAPPAAADAGEEWSSAAATDPRHRAPAAASLHHARTSAAAGSNNMVNDLPDAAGADGPAPVQRSTGGITREEIDMLLDLHEPDA